MYRLDPEDGELTKKSANEQVHAAGGRGAALWLALRYLSGTSLLAAVGVLLGGFGWLLFWPAFSLALVAWCHGTKDSRIFGKRPDGSIPLSSLILLGPYLAFVRSFFHLKRWLLCQAPFHQISDGLYLGRLPVGGALPDGTRTVVDVTCEFAEPSEARNVETYHCLPTLNRWIAPMSDLRALLDRLRTAPTPIYVHCGAGKGRSTLVMAALLVDRGLAPDPESAFEMIQSRRPFVSLHPVQWRQLCELGMPEAASELLQEPQGRLGDLGARTEHRRRAHLP